MQVNDKIKNALNGFGLNLTKDLKASLKKALDDRVDNYNKKDSKNKSRKRKSRLEASILANPVTYKESVLRFTLQMNDYWDIVDGGRKPSSVSREGQKKLEEWAGNSGFAEQIRLTDLQKRKSKKKMDFQKAKKQAGFLVARSLKKKRIEATNFFTDVIKDGRVEELKKEIEKILKTEIQINIGNVTSY